MQAVDTGKNYSLSLHFLNQLSLEVLVGLRVGSEHLTDTVLVDAYVVHIEQDIATVVFNAEEATLQRHRGHVEYLAASCEEVACILK